MDTRIGGIEAVRRKKETKIKYRRWRRGKRTKEDFMESRKGLREFFIRKRKEKRREEEVKLKNIKKESEIWAFINRRRKKRERGENNIGKEE